MKIVFDTSVIVEIDRKNREVIDIVKKLIEGNHTLMISTVTVSEILTGSYLRRDFRRSVTEAKRILGQFLWIDLDSAVAEKTGQYISHLIVEGSSIEYQDTVIAATFKITDANYLVTLNKKHFDIIPDLKGKVFTPAEFRKVLR
jgi:predicted nucleic acid-binding protein